MFSSQNKSLNKIVISLTAIFLIVLGLELYLNWNKNQPKSNQFSGPVDRVEGSSIFAKGVFMVNNKPYSMNLSAVKIAVTPETKLLATTLYAPSAEDLKKTGGVWDMAHLKKETSNGSLDDLKRDAPIIFVETNGDVLGKVKFDAAKISYTIIKYPKTNFKTGQCEDANGKFIGVETCAAKH